MKTIKLIAKYCDKYDKFEFVPQDNCEVTEAFFDVLCYNSFNDLRCFSCFTIFELIKILGLSCEIIVENKDGLKLSNNFDRHGVDNDYPSKVKNLILNIK